MTLLRLIPPVLSFLAYSAYAVGAYEIRDDETGGDCEKGGIGVWDQPTKTCTLSDSISAGIEVSDDGIHLHGAGHTVKNGDAEFDGVSLRNRQNVRVTDLVIEGFMNGVAVTRGGGHSISEVRVIGSLEGGLHCGILVWFSSGNLIERNVIGDSPNPGICLMGHSRHNRVEGNDIQSPRYAGIWQWVSGDNVVLFNSVDMRGLPGRAINLENTNGNFIAYNRLQGIRGSGIDLLESNQNTLVYNSIEGSLDGILLFNAHSNELLCNDSTTSRTAIGIRGGSQTNAIWMNNFFGEGDASDDGGVGGNAFNQPVAPPGGNHWSSHGPSCVDAKGDGFCDQPKTISGAQELTNRDQYPWKQVVPWRVSPVACFESWGSG